MLGFILSYILVIFIVIGIVAAVVSSTQKEVTVEKKTVLVLKLNTPIAERTSDNPFSSMKFGSFDNLNDLGLDDILSNIKKAERDDNIKGIYLDLSDFPSGMGTLEDIRNALISFKKSGKFIVSYGEVYSQKAYYLATVSDKIYLNPEGDLMLKGMGGELMFFKGTLEKLGIEMQIIRHGKFKAATEPFFLDKMSPENRVQTQAYVNALWNHMVQGMAESRKITPEEINAMADKLAIENPQAAIARKLVDSLSYKDGVLEVIRKKLGIGKDVAINTIGINKYDDVFVADTKKESSKDKIAVVYAFGDVVDGEGDQTNIGGERISRAIRKARLDKNVKAVVLRVNSGGGSALASEVILREILLTRQAKPVVASFGDVAASGGYYIACAANTIFAQPNTITGSIGVFGIIPNLGKMMKDKLGITTDLVKTNENSDYFPTTHPLSDYQKAVLTRSIEKIYGTFIKHVSEGRKMTVAQVDSIGQGRVWSGVDAKRIGLIDNFGGLDKAIEAAAGLAKLKNYKVTKLPEMKDPFSQILEQFSGDYKEDAIMKSYLGDQYVYLKKIKDLKNMHGIQARMPFEIDLK